MLLVKEQHPMYKDLLIQTYLMMKRKVKFQISLSELIPTKHALTNVTERLQILWFALFQASRGALPSNM